MMPDLAFLRSENGGGGGLIQKFRTHTVVWSESSTNITAIIKSATYRILSALTCVLWDYNLRAPLAAGGVVRVTLPFPVTPQSVDELNIGRKTCTAVRSQCNPVKKASVWRYTSTNVSVFPCLSTCSTRMIQRSYHCISEKLPARLSPSEGLKSATVASSAHKTSPLAAAQPHNHNQSGSSNKHGGKEEGPGSARGEAAAAAGSTSSKEK